MVTRLLPILALSAAIAASPASAGDDLGRIRAWDGPGALQALTERMGERREREAASWHDLGRDLRMDRLERRLDSLELDALEFDPPSPYGEILRR